jgi:hypothetical protein
LGCTVHGSTVHFFCLLLKKSAIITEIPFYLKKQWFLKISINGSSAVWVCDEKKLTFSLVPSSIKLTCSYVMKKKIQILLKRKKLKKGKNTGLLRSLEFPSSRCISGGQFDFKLGGGGQRGIVVGDVFPVAHGLGLDVRKRWRFCFLEE